MNQFFLVTREKGPSWNAKWPMNQQSYWRKHADFMNTLTTEGFVRLGGPVDDANTILLVVYGENEESIRARLADDPWEPDLLKTTNIRQWSVMLESPKGLME